MQGSVIEKIWGEYKNFKREQEQKVISKTASLEEILL